MPIVERIFDGLLILPARVVDHDARPISGGIERHPKRGEAKDRRKPRPTCTN